jgi:signal transduction histidine kinase/ligand-binding sensor domain-containing protein
MMRPIQLGPALLAGAALVAGPASGQDRLARRFTSAGDVAVGHVVSLAQDSIGFIWLGTPGGLLRWDGLELRRVAPDQIDAVTYQTVCPDGTLYVVEGGGTLFEVRPDTSRPAPGPGGGAFEQVVNQRCDSDGRLWVTTGSTVWRREPDGRWHEVAPGTFAGDVPFILQGPPGPGVWLRTRQTLWRLEADGRARAILDAPQPQAVFVGSGGDTLLLTRGRGLFRVGAGAARLTPLVPALGRGIDMQPRGTTVWVSFDRYLVAIRPGEPPEVIGSENLPEGGGLMLIDREGSLWVGTFSGLVQFPEPETTYWYDRHGFPSAHARFIARTRDRVWASTWQGLGYVETRAGRRTAHTLPPDWQTAMPLYVDARDVLWVATPAGLREIAGVRTIRVRPFPYVHWDVEPAPNGGVWLASSAGLMHAPASGADVVPVPGSPFAPGVPVRLILRTRDGHLWLAGYERVCGSTAPAVAPRDAAWTCDSIPGAVEIRGLVEMPSGAVWLGTQRLGVWRRHDGRWEPIPGNNTLAARSVHTLRPARDDGIWILGMPDLPRVRENLAAPQGWDVLETITAWHGIPPPADVLEDADSTVWMTTSLGIARVPPAARNAPLPFVRVVLVEVAVDGVPVRGDEPVSLRHRHNRLDVRFAALSYRDQAKIRYQVRLAPQPEWSDHVGPPAFRWIDLPAGNYRAEVRASLDGRTWSPTPATFAVAVRTPWYLDPWVLAFGVVAVVAVAYAGHRARLAVALRLERQRTQISLDLHDEMGSGLGSIGILSGVLTGGELASEERRRLATKIGEIAGELGASLSDIVWSLRPHTNALADVAARLAEHGARLFAGDAARFEARFPAHWPTTPLGFSVSRAVLLIGLEALYNAARHAGARRVTLTVASEGRAWALSVEDDGRGLPEEAAAGGARGLGRGSMQRRAEEIGAELTWESTPGGGTRVTLRLVPRRRLSGERLT